MTDDDLQKMIVRVATIGGEVAGFYSLAPSAGSWSLEGFWVLPELMQRGVGHALLRDALETAFGGNAVVVAVDADPNAERFYLRCGAVRVGEMTAPIPGDADRIRPQLEFRKART